MKDTKEHMLTRSFFGSPLERAKSYWSCARVAQKIEQIPAKYPVAGASPAGGTKKSRNGFLPGRGGFTQCFDRLTMQPCATREPQ